ncbi:hypothetical protein [Acinetobacter terrae]|uniref:DUF4760 domain-containing protein n=1 Tax=Acinetobacter terrae TaxID=2731247 RepID=A0A4V2LP76_9GAMM|nr:hypothetical protein [Acinetobacter terrae]TCB55591.1 hypothetical protein E0H85_15030 [Acinetobacter terrae]
MNIIDDKKLSLIMKLAISYVLLLNFVFLFYVFNTDPSSDQTARGAVFTNLLVWSATLYAPLAAFFLYDSWKEQKQYEITKELMIDVITVLSDLYIKIGKAINLAERLKEIDNDKITLQSFINAKELRNVDDLNKIYALIHLYENITGDKALMKYKSNFDKTTFEIETFLTKLDLLYLQYFESLDLKIESNFTRTQTYKKDEKAIVKNNIDAINNIFKNPMPFSNNEIPYDLSFDQSKKNFERSYENFIQKISEILNP